MLTIKCVHFIGLRMTIACLLLGLPFPNIEKRLKLQYCTINDLILINYSGPRLTAKLISATKPKASKLLGLFHSNSVIRVTGKHVFFKHCKLTGSD